MMIALWLVIAIALVALGSFTTRLSTLMRKDLFYSLRGDRHLGVWSHRQPSTPWYRMVQPPPVGPVIGANLSHGFCGRPVVYLSRLPLSASPGQTAWSLLLALVHPTLPINSHGQKSFRSLPQSDMVDAGQRTPHASDSEALILKNSWSALPLCPLQKHNSTTVVKISRPTFITLLCLTNPRQVISYSDSSGYRASFPSYCGRWYLKWRIGGPAFARLGVHDSHTLCKDPYPEAFEQRVDACLQMLAGVVESRSVRGFRCGFPGRKSSGKWVLEYEPRGFGGRTVGGIFTT